MRFFLRHEVELVRGRALEGVRSLGGWVSRLFDPVLNTWDVIEKHRRRRTARGGGESLGIGFIFLGQLKNHWLLPLRSKKFVGGVVEAKKLPEHTNLRKGTRRS